VARGKYRNSRQEALGFDEDVESGDDDELDAEDSDDLEFGDASFEEGDDEAYEHEAAEPEDSRPALTLRQRLAVAIAPKPPAPRTPRPPRETRPPASAAKPKPAFQLPEGKTLEDMMNNLDRREKSIALAAAVLEVAYAIVVAIALRHPVKGTKVQVNGAILASVIGVPGLLLGGGVFIGRRALVGFLALLAGLAIFSAVGPIEGFIYLGIGLWLLLKAQKYNRMAREANGQPPPKSLFARRAELREQGASGKAGSARTARTKPASTRGKANTSGPAVPVKSKRYTPPRPQTPAGRRAPSS
jgi:hypothetical protein